MKKTLFILCLLFGACTAVHSQTPAYCNLVMEGGGIRGIAYGGALQELERQGVLQQIERVAGTSAGAIQAALLAVGFTPDEITKITFETPVQQFNDGRFVFLGGAHRLFKQYGWYRGDKFTEWLGERLQEKTGNASITLGELHQLAHQPAYRDLYVTGTNLTTQQTVIFSHETYPHMQVRHAVRISMSVPLYYRAVLLDKQGHVVAKPAKNQETDIMVDGGLLANYPINVFDAPRYGCTAAPEAKNPEPGEGYHNPQTLGLRLDRSEQIAYDKQQNGLAPYTINRLSDYISAFYILVIENLNRQHLTPEDWNRTISISTAGLSPRVRKLSVSEKSILLESGRKSTQAFLLGH